MNKLIGYLIAIAGLVITILGFNLSKWKIPILSTAKPYYVIIAGLILLIFGIVLVLSKRKAGQVSEEVPIYEGKKIVGYRRAK